MNNIKVSIRDCFIAMNKRDKRKLLKIARDKLGKKSNGGKHGGN